MKVDKEELRTIGLSALKNYLLVDMSDIDPKIAIHLLQRAKIGLQIEKEMNLQSRAFDNNSIRIFRLSTEDKNEFKRLVRKSALSNYLPQ